MSYKYLKGKGASLFLLWFLLLVPLLLISCNSNTTSVYFPVLKEPISAYPEGAFKGWLILDNNCLRLKGFYFFGKGSLLIWPNGYSLETENGRIHVVDNNGNIVARVGERIKFAGGEIPKESVEQLIGESLPENVTGPFILFGYIDNE